MEFTDTYPKILELLDTMGDEFNLSLWRNYAMQVSQNLPQKILDDIISYDFKQEILPVVQQTMHSKMKLEESHDSFLSATKNLSERFTNVFQTDLQVNIIFYLGLCNGAGWATSLDGQKMVLLGAEKIIELDWCSKNSICALIYHELGHIWHDTVGTMSQATHSQSEQSVLQLWQEGIAMYCEQLLCEDFQFYHQNKNGWLDWCNKNKSPLFSEYLRRIDAMESTQDFFGDWCSYKGFSDVGYYLGCEFVKWLAKKHSLNTIANMTVSSLTVELRSLCASLQKSEEKQ